MCERPLGSRSQQNTSRGHAVTDRHPRYCVARLRLPPELVPGAMVLSVRPGSEPTGRWTLLCAPELASSAAAIGKIGKIGAVAATPPARPVGGARAVSRQSGEQLLEGGVAAMSGDEALQAVLAQARAVAASDAHDRIGIARERLPVVWTGHVNAVGLPARLPASAARCAAGRPP
jgi:hypothetical protein